MERTVRSHLTCFLVILTNLLLAKVSGLKLLQVSIPPLKLTGQSARLACLYDLEGDTLYSIKWYKGGREFFRYVQRDQPPIQVFPVDGVWVDKSQSDQYQVTLTQLTIASAGRYKCEVSVDAPSFQTSFSTVEMTIVALPESGPRISTRGHHFDSSVYSSQTSFTSGRSSSVAVTTTTTDKSGDHASFHSYYRPGDDDQVEINCTSARSKPAAALHWYVNGIKVKGEYLVEYAPFEDGDSTLETTVLGLRWKLPDSGSLLLSNNGSTMTTDSPIVVVLNCTAAVGSVYWSSASLTLSPEPGSGGGKSRPMLMYHESHLSSANAHHHSSFPFVLLLVSTIVLLLLRPSSTAHY